MHPSASWLSPQSAAQMGAKLICGNLDARVAKIFQANHDYQLEFQLQICAGDRRSARHFHKLFDQVTHLCQFATWLDLHLVLIRPPPSD